jgi:hypothetical protein
MQGSIAACLLDAADTDEAAAVAHVRSCPSCSELARRLAKAAAAVPLSVDPVEPPPGLRSRILKAAGRRTGGSGGRPFSRRWNGPRG